MTETPGVWQRLWGRRVARTAMIVLGVVALAAMVGPALMPAGSGEVSGNQFSPPAMGHPFGTDLDGRDVLYRVLTGARVSLLVVMNLAVDLIYMGLDRRIRLYD